MAVRAAEALGQLHGLVDRGPERSRLIIKEHFVDCKAKHIAIDRCHLLQRERRRALANHIVDRSLVRAHAVDQRGADALRRLCSAWVELFKLGPPKLDLTGAWVTGPDNASGRYERLRLDRDELVDALSTLAAFASHVQDGTHFIVHLGI